jgi:serine/threonine protein kinase
MTMSILELLQHIVNEPAPRLTPEGRYPAEAEEFVDSCLLKDPDARMTPKDLLVSLGHLTCILFFKPVAETSLDRKCQSLGD